MHFCSHPGPILERQRATPSSAMLPLPPRLMVDGSTFALPRAFDLLANCPLHRLPSNSIHLGDHHTLCLLGDSMFGMAMEGSEGSHYPVGKDTRWLLCGIFSHSCRVQLRLLTGVQAGFVDLRMQRPTGIERKLIAMLRRSPCSTLWTVGCPSAFLFWWLALPCTWSPFRKARTHSMLILLEASRLNCHESCQIWTDP